MIPENHPLLTPASISGRYLSYNASIFTSRLWNLPYRWSISFHQVSKSASLDSVEMPGPQVAAR
jgi:hypothetical protein